MRESIHRFVRLRQTMYSIIPLVVRAGADEMLQGREVPISF
jgi:hypothetical protein